MRYLLDSNAVIGLLAGKPSLWHAVHQRKATDIGIPTIVMHELYFGASQSIVRDTSLGRIDGLQFGTLDFSRDDAREAGFLRASLKATGKPIGPYDLLIAGQARARDLILVTHNTREFSRVDGLRIEDWET